MPPVVTGGALVIPEGLLCELMGIPLPQDFSIENRKAVELAGMNAVMELEKKLGYMPKDVSAENRGYDVESAVPKELRDDGNCLRFIEVKARVKGAETVTVSKNEMLLAMTAEDKAILALVEVDGTNAKTVYLKRPFNGLEKPGFMEVSRTFSISHLKENAEIIYQE